MFNGIIKKTGRLKQIYRGDKSYFIEIVSDVKFSKNEIGASISCSGACLTLEKVNGNLSRYFLSHETISKTNFKTSKKGDIINLEKPLKYGDRISGHFVQGHIDTTSRIKKINIVGRSWFINFKLDKLSNRIDWAIKEKLFSEFMESENLDWDNPMLQSLDLEYHTLDPDRGLYRGLEQEKEIYSLCTEKEISRAIEFPPEKTRAKIRGDAVSKESEKIKRIHWTGIEFENGDLLDLTEVISQEDVDKIHVAK